MTNTRAAAWIGGGVLLVAWFAAAVGAPPSAPARDPHPAVQDSEKLSTIAADIQTQAARLRERLSRAPVPNAPLRNPFVFDSARHDTPDDRVATAGVAPDAPPAPSVPMLSLIGVAEDASAAGPRRTAIIAGDGDALYMVAKGEAVGSRYRVAAIGADAVELADLVTGGRRRLALR